MSRCRARWTNTPGGATFVLRTGGPRPNGALDLVPFALFAAISGRADGGFGETALPGFEVEKSLEQAFDGMFAGFEGRLDTARFDRFGRFRAD